MRTNPVEIVPAENGNIEDSVGLVQDSDIVYIECEEEDSHTTMVLMDSEYTQAIPVARAISVPVVDPILQKAHSASGIGSLFGLDYYRLIAADVLEAIDGNSAMKSKTIPKKKVLFSTHVVRQCAVDRRDLGTLPYVVSLDAAFNATGAFVLNDLVSDVVIKTVSNTDVEALKAGCDIFTQRGLLGGNSAQLAEDMRVFSTPPYKLVGAWRGKIMVGVSVFRGFSMNNGERFVHIELLATLMDISPGVGSALMRVLRKLSQISPLHTGHIGAFTLRTRNALRFYDRKLPERNGPHARSLLVSMVCVDELISLYSHLDMRYSSVFPDNRN